MPYRNTVPAAWSLFFSHMQTLQSGGSAPFRQVAEGEGAPDAYPVPFLLLQLLSAKISSRADNDKQWEMKIRLRAVSESTSADGATTAILSKISATQDKIEALVKPDGVSGFEDGEWSITYDKSAERGNLVIGEMVTTCNVMVTRGSN